MRLIKPSYEIWQQPSGHESKKKKIKRAGRVCYRYEDKITEDSAKPFVDRMIKSGHGAMLEHGTVYLKTNDEYYGNPIDKYRDNKYSQLKSINGTKYVTTNLRALIENE